MKNLLRSVSGLLLLMFLFSGLFANAQDTKKTLQSYLEKNKGKWGLSSADVKDWIITDQYTEGEPAITHVYLHQQHQGLRIFGAVSSAALRDGKVQVFSNRFTGNVAEKANASKAAISPKQAIVAAAGHLGLNLKGSPALQSRSKKQHLWKFKESGLSLKPITVELVYQVVGNTLRLAYDVNIAVRDSHDWWNVRVDANTGEFLDKNNWTVSCDFDHLQGFGMGNGTNGLRSGIEAQAAPSPQTPPPGDSYRVFPLPLEAPTFGPRQLLTNPSDVAASPFGWHDTDGITGDEYTYTRGNNVFAYTDTLAADIPQYSPDGGTSLNFDFPLDFNQEPTFSKSAIVTNLFYVNNRVHDILLHHGFTSAAGNFQENNYGNGGQGQDFVLAEAQDGGGTNNANFSTPPDGQSGVMQMYLWNTTPNVNFTVNSPLALAGVYSGSGMSAFGPAVSAAITNDLVLVNDNVVPTTDACEPIANGAAMNGKIALIDRGTCTFVSKVQAAEAMGALAVMIINNVASAPTSMGGTGNVGIPSFMISQADGNALKIAIGEGSTVNVTIPAMTAPISIDGSLDNGIVTHEYAHGLSNRLSGGPSNTGCLYNVECASEGWSDWLALIMTIDAGDVGTNHRPVGTYAISEPITGGGIRSYPYSTDMTVNPQTYASIALDPEIHAIGEIWTSALWDMTWNLIDFEGFTTDWISGSGGNIVAMKLVLEGMKLQPCNPGFLDSRDAILAADSLLYNGIHTCLIWKAFAGRGMGANAIQGSPDVIGDEVEDFELPSSCAIPSSLPLANFSVNMISNCTGEFLFTDLSDSIPQSWKWDFGDGSPFVFSKNPSHTYAAPGVYTVVLVVSNSLGSDTTDMTVTYALLPTPVASNDTAICYGQSANLSAPAYANSVVDWYSGTTMVHSGTSFLTPLLYAATTYTVLQHEPIVTASVGPVDNTFGSGGNHNTTFEGKERFETQVPLRLLSCWVVASGGADRTFNLYDQNGTTLLQSISVYVPNGQSTVNLNIDIPNPGAYWLGVSAPSNLYRNNAGASYPYTISNMISITSSNATGTPLDFYYYLYDWKVEKHVCGSASDTVTVIVLPTVTPDFTYAAVFNAYSFTDLTVGSPNSWHWDFGDGQSSSQQNPTHVYAVSGTYTVLLTVSNGLCSDTLTKVVDVVTGIGELNNAHSISIAPVPARDVVRLSFRNALQGSVNIDILSLEGKKMRSYQFSNVSGQLVLDLMQIPDGMYFLRIENQGSFVVKKLNVVN